MNAAPSELLARRLRRTRAKLMKKIQELHERQRTLPAKWLEKLSQKERELRALAEQLDELLRRLCR